MRYPAIVLCLLLLSCQAMASTEIYTGHSVRGMSEFTGDEVMGILTDAGPLKLGAGRFTATHYAHVLYELNAGPFFAGVGAGWVDEHPSLDGPFQFTLTGGANYPLSADHNLVVRWMHFSNGAGIFNRHNENAQIRNAGIDFLTFGITF